MCCRVIRGLSSVVINSLHNSNHPLKIEVNPPVTECICTLCLCCCTLYVTLSVSVSSFFFCWVWGRIMTSFICNKARGNNNGLSHVPSEREEIKSGTSGCGSFVVPYIQPDTLTDLWHLPRWCVAAQVGKGVGEGRGLKKRKKPHMQSSHPMKCTCQRTNAYTRWPPEHSAGEHYNNNDMSQAILLIQTLPFSYTNFKYCREQQSQLVQPIAAAGGDTYATVVQEYWCKQINRIPTATPSTTLVLPMHAQCFLRPTSLLHAVVSCDPLVQEQVVVPWLFKVAQVLFGTWCGEYPNETTLATVFIDGFRQDPNIIWRQRVKDCLQNLLGKREQTGDRLSPCFSSPKRTSLNATHCLFQTSCGDTLNTSWWK